MKKIVFTMLLGIVMASGVQAQIRKVPSEVTNAFKSKFPAAKDVEWKDKLTYFEAQFKEGETKMTVDFTSKGEWQKTEKALTFAEAPGAVKDGLSKSKYASASEWKPGDVVTMISKEDKSTQYRVYVDKVNGVQKKYLYFNPSGKLEKESLTL